MGCVCVGGECVCDCACVGGECVGACVCVGWVGYLDDQFSSLHTFQYQFSVPTCIHIDIINIYSGHTHKKRVSHHDQLMTIWQLYYCCLEASDGSGHSDWSVTKEEVTLHSEYI